MAVTQDIDLAQDTIWADFYAFPTGLAKSGVNQDELGPVMVCTAITELHCDPFINLCLREIIV